MALYEYTTDKFINVVHISKASIAKDGRNRFFIMIEFDNGEIVYRGPFATRAAVDIEMTLIKGVIP